MKEIRKNFNLLTIGAMMLDVIIIVLGMFLIANPSVGINSALMLLGIILIVSGLYSLVKYSVNKQIIFRFELIYGIASLVAGLLALFKPFAVANLITVLVGFWLIITSIFKFAVALELKKVNIESWTFDMSLSVITIFLGLLLVINPFRGYIILSTYAAIMLIVYAGVDLVEQLTIRRRANKIMKFFK